MVYAKVIQTWTGGPSSLTNPENQEVITLSKKALLETGGLDLEKLNYTVEYDVTDLKYRANLSMALIFDGMEMVSQTDLKGVQGKSYATFRQRFLPQYDNMKSVGTHHLQITLKLRPQWSVLHLYKNYYDWKELKCISESTVTRLVVLTE